MSLAALASGIAKSFSYPDRVAGGEIRSDLFASELVACARDVGLVGSLDRLRNPLAEVSTIDLDTLQGEHTFLFARNVVCSLNASAYEYQQGLRSTRGMGDVASFYGAFGYAVSTGAHELADHITVELEFLGVLAAKEKYARARGWTARARLCRAARAAFAEEYLLSWLPTLGRRLDARARMPFYPAMCAAATELASICSRTGREASP
jgi:TorA maturation chaperone TorD